MKRGMMPESPREAIWLSSWEVRTNWEGEDGGALAFAGAGCGFEAGCGFGPGRTCDPG